VAGGWRKEIIDPEHEIPGALHNHRKMNKCLPLLQYWHIAGYSASQP
jgi:hypothetical protein